MPGLLVFSGADYTTSGRITALALDPACSEAKCRVWIGAAGGGVWRTKNAWPARRSGSSSPADLPTNAIGALTYDAASGTLYAGTGEPNASATARQASACSSRRTAATRGRMLAGRHDDDDLRPVHGQRVHGSRDQRDHGRPDEPERHLRRPPRARSAASARCRTVRRRSADAAARPRRLQEHRRRPDVHAAEQRDVGFRSSSAAPPTSSSTRWITTRSTRRCSARASTARPTAARTGRRSSPADRLGGNIERDSIAVAALPNGKTRIYIGAGSSTGTFDSRLYRTRRRQGTACRRSRTSRRPERGNYCTAQCWYDNVVYSPPGQPDTVYLGGSYDYTNAGTCGDRRGTDRPHERARVHLLHRRGRELHRRDA